MAALVNATRTGEAEVPVTVDMIRDEWEDPRLRLEEDTWAAIDTGGNYVAVAEVWLGEADFESEQILRHIGFTMLPELRESHRELMEEIFGRAVDHAVNRPFAHPDKPYALRAWASALDGWKNQWLAEHGFELTHLGYTMVHDDLANLPAIPQVEGVHLEGRTPARDAELWHAVNEAFSTDPSFVPLSGMEWDQLFSSDPSEFSHWLVAVESATDRVIGFTIAEIDQEINQVTGQREGWVMDLAVLPEWRGRRLGRALVLTAMHELRESGMTVIKMGVDAIEPPEQAIRLHQQLGFRIQKGSHTYHRPLHEPPFA